MRLERLFVHASRSIARVAAAVLAGCQRRGEFEDGIADADRVRGAVTVDACAAGRGRFGYRIVPYGHAQSVDLDADDAASTRGGYSTDLVAIGDGAVSVHVDTDVYGIATSGEYSGNDVVGHA